MRQRRHTTEAREGVVLLAVLIVVVLLTLAAYQFGELTSAEARAADSYVRSAQARVMAESGVHYAAALLSNPDTFSGTLNGNPFDNSGAFHGILVQPNDKPRMQGRFSIVAPLSPDEASTNGQGFRFGVIDECGRINLNALLLIDSSGQVAHDMLMKLPNMTEDVANSILDWIDPDDEPRSNGAESEYYSSLTPPYRCKNGPLDSLEELLLVKGVTPQLLFGNDWNRNGMLDAEEDDGSGTVDMGWSAYLTVYSRERNLDSQGSPRIYVNDSDLESLFQKLSTALGPDLANYIIAYRLYGPAATTPAAGGGSTPPRSTTGGGSQVTSVTVTPTGAVATSRTGSSSQTTTPSGATAATTEVTGRGPIRVSPQARSGRGGGQPRSLASLYELINSQVSIPGDTPQAPATRYSSPLNDPGQLQQLLPLLLDKVTTVRGTEIPARINVNTASRVVLMALPGLSEENAQSIIDHRPDPSSTEFLDPTYQTPTWLLTQANLTPQTLRSLERYITARSQVYRVQSVGYFDGGGPRARIEAVIDTNAGRPRITYWRDLTELGRGYNLSGQ